MLELSCVFERRRYAKLDIRLALLINYIYPLSDCSPLQVEWKICSILILWNRIISYLYCSLILQTNCQSGWSWKTFLPGYQHASTHSIALPVANCICGLQADEAEAVLARAAIHVTARIYMFDENSTFWATTDGWTIFAFDNFCWTAFQYTQPFVSPIAVWIPAFISAVTLPFLQTGPTEFKHPLFFLGAHDTL